MTAAREKVEWTCPRCDEPNESYVRRSLNTAIVPWTEDQVREATTLTCVRCGLRTGVDVLVVSWPGPAEPYSPNRSP